MRLLLQLAALSASVLALPACSSDAAVTDHEHSPGPGARPGAAERDAPSISAALSGVFDGTPVPGAVAAIARAEGVTEVGAWGLRKAGGEAAMSSADAVHVGSDTKAMTAVLAARLVDAGELRWDSTLQEVLPALAPRVHEAYRGATLTHFLRHTSGAPANARDWRQFPDRPLRERRLEIAAASLGEAPAAAPGTRFQYSNLGYLVAGLMIEVTRDQPWEELMRTEVFKPLGILGAGFGAPGTTGEEPGTTGEENAAWGHVLRAKPQPVQIDNDPALGPAGTVHLPVADWARFALQFTDAAAMAEDPDAPFLSPAARKKLVEVGLDDHSFGWIVTERGWAGGTALTHSGSNTTWYATAWVAPRSNRAYLVAVNAAGAGVPGLVDSAIGALIELDD